MIRLLMAGLIVLMAGNANAAINNENLFKVCKAFADNNFTAHTSKGLVCLSYFAGVADTSWANCLLGTKTGISISEKNANASIKHYVNKMENTPEKWNDLAVADVIGSLICINGIVCPPKE